MSRPRSQPFPDKRDGSAASQWRNRQRAAHLGVPPESHEMLRLAEFLDATVGTHGWMHCPNEGKRSARTGASLKRQGMKPGFPDVLIFKPVNAWSTETSSALAMRPLLDARLFTREGRIPACPEIRGVAIELKREGAPLSALTTEQRKWGNELANRGWYWFAAAGADQAIRELLRLGYAK